MEQGKKVNNSEEEEDRKGKCQYITSITSGLPRAKNPSKGTMKRKIVGLMVVSCCSFWIDCIMQNNMVCSSCFCEKGTHVRHDVLAGVAHLSPTSASSLAHFLSAILDLFLIDLLLSFSKLIN